MGTEEQVRSAIELFSNSGIVDVMSERLNCFEEHLVVLSRQELQ